MFFIVIFDRKRDGAYYYYCGLTSGVDVGVILSLVGVAGEKIVPDDVLMDVVMLCLEDLLGEFLDGKLNVFVHRARLLPMF